MQQQNTPLGVAGTTRSVLQRLPWIRPAQRLSAELTHGRSSLRPREGAVMGEGRGMRFGIDAENNALNAANSSVDVDEEGVVAFTQRTVCAA